MPRRSTAQATEVAHDSIRAYLERLGGAALLTREAEIELAKTIEASERAVLEAIASSSRGVAEIARLGRAIQSGRSRVRDVADESEEPDAAPSPDETSDVFCSSSSASSRPRAARTSTRSPG